MTGLNYITGLLSVAGLAASDCYNFPAVADNEDPSFLGSIQYITVGPASIAYRRFGPLSTGSFVQQRPLVSARCSMQSCCCPKSIPMQPMHHACQTPQVLVLGISLTMHDWTPRLLKALAAQREVVILDTPGIGLSVINQGSAPSPQDYFIFQAECVAGLMAGLGLQQPDLLGCCVCFLSC